MDESNEVDFLEKPIVWIQENMTTLLNWGAMFLFWSGALLALPGILWWGQIFGIDCTGKYWDVCDQGTIGILFDGVIGVLFIWSGAMSAVFLKMILLGIAGKTASSDTTSAD